MNQLELQVSEVGYALAQMDMVSVRALHLVVQTVRQAGGVVYTCGNGGSHSTASHFANDLLKVVNVRAVCLGDMVPAMLAFGNDEGWENMYAEMVGRLLRPGDGVVGFTCSGESENVLRALKVAKVRKNLVVGLTGHSLGSRIGKMGLDVLVRVPEVDDMRVQEDVHLIVCHAVVRMYDAA